MERSKAIETEKRPAARKVPAEGLVRCYSNGYLGRSVQASVFSSDSLQPFHYFLMCLPADAAL